jgi:hypothetical protein
LRIISNISGSTAAPIGNTLSAVFDAILGSSRGMIVYRGSAGWAALSPGTSGQVLTTGGTAGDPAWAPTATGASITVSDTPPASPSPGDAWWDGVSGQLYIRVNDGTSTQWVPASNQPGPPGAGISGLTPTRVPFAATATTLADDGSLVWDNTNKRLGIGTTAPPAKLTVSANTAALPAPSAGTVLQVGGADATSARIDLQSFGVTPAFIFRFATGSAGTPAPVASGNEVGRIAAFGYGATTYSSGRAAIAFPATQTWTDAAQGVGISFSTTLNGTAVSAEAMRVDHNGNLGIGTTAPFTTLHSSRSVAGGLPATSGSTDANVFARFQGATVAVDLGVTGGGDTWLQPRSAGNFATNFPLLLSPNGGYVGIGTGTPGTAKLGVTGSATAGALDVAVAGGPNSADTTTKLVGFYDAGIITLQGAITRNGAAAVAYGTASDVRRKDNISASNTGLKAVMALKVRDFTFKGDGRKQQGLIAQEVAQVYPIAVHEGGDDPALEPWLVDYGRLTPLLIRAVQQLQEEIDELKRQLRA